MREERVGKEGGDSRGGKVRGRGEERETDVEANIDSIGEIRR